MRWARFFGVGLLVAACSGTSTPASTPIYVPTTTTSTTTTLAPTTTVDRLAEIEAIYQDLEERRLDALYTGDREAYLALFANDAYMQTSLELLELVEFQDDWQPVDVVVTEVLHDSAECFAVRVGTDYSLIFVDGGVADSVRVVEK